jgi:hypothetical protein
MISIKLRNALAAVAVLVMIGGPVLVALGLFATVMLGEMSGRIFGEMLELFFSSLIAGGVLRLLVSIDARLEAKV